VAAVEHPAPAQAGQVESESVPLAVTRVAGADDRDPVARLDTHPPSDRTRCSSWSTSSSRVR
jgi:hypothetical protein